MRQRHGVVTREGNILDPATRENGIRTLAVMPEHRGLVPGQANTLDSATRETESRTLQKMHEHRGFGTTIERSLRSTLNGTSQTVIQRPDLNGRSPKRRKTPAAKSGATKRITSVMTKRPAVIGTSGMTVTGGTIIVTRSFS